MNVNIQDLPPALSPGMRHSRDRADFHALFTNLFLRGSMVLQV
jgi:hypothetical protein